METSEAAPVRPTTRTGPGDGPVVGYVVKCYPRFSETFVVREVIAREAAGERIAIASLRAPKDPRFHADLARVRAGVTWIPTGSGSGRSTAAAWRALDDVRVLVGGVLPQPALTALADEEPDVAAQGVLLAAWALQQGVGHLHAHFASLPARTTRLAALLTGLPWSVTAHAKDLFHADVDPRRLRAVLAGPHGADAVVAVSDSSTAWVRERFPTAPVHRVHNGLELAGSTSGAARGLAWSSPRRRPAVVAAVGRLVPKKGFDDLLAAVAVLRDRGVPARLRLAGAGEQEGALRARVGALDLHDRVELLGPLTQEEVVDLVRGAAVMAAPCRVAEDGDRDGLPTVVLEALALGTPVVSTPVVGVPEAVETERTGLLVPERDPLALADALERLLQDADLRERLSVAGRARVEERFDVRDQARALAALTGATAPSAAVA